MNIENLELQINENIINEFKKQNISTEYLGSVIFILLALNENRTDLLDSFDDRNKGKRAMILYDYLMNKGFLSKADLEDDVHYNLTDKALEFIDFLRSEINNDQTKSLEQHHPLMNSENKTLQLNKEDESPEHWIEEYINIFPKEKVGSRYLRTNKIECVVKMIWFIKTYKFNKETILRATRAYISNQESNQENYPFTRNSNYFISKQTGQGKEGKISDLATWCERVVNDDDTPRFDTSIMNSA